MKRSRRRILGLILGLATLTSTNASPASAADSRVVIYQGSCQLHLTFYFNQPIGFGTFTNPSYSIVAQPVTGTPPCQITDDPLDPLRTTSITASGWASLWDCDAAVASGGWSQRWYKLNGEPSPGPVEGGGHKLYGTYDNWFLEMEGPNLAQFAGAMHLKIEPAWAGFTAAACSNGSLWELRTIGTQVFQDPQP
ncbi:MAG: hypothetical protein ACRDHM_02145 [Actinomycetota bacterium]